MQTLVKMPSKQYNIKVHNAWMMLVPYSKHLSSWIRQSLFFQQIPQCLSRKLHISTNLHWFMICCAIFNDLWNAASPAFVAMTYKVINGNKAGTVSYKLQSGSLYKAIKPLTTAVTLSVMAVATYKWGGANWGGLRDGSPPEAQSFSKNMYKIWSNLTKNFKNLALL